jgi:Tfp pilus assembly protein PilN
VGIALLAAGIALCAYDFRAYDRAGEDIARIESRMKGGRVARPPGGAARQDTEALRRQISLASKVVEQRSLQWDALFKDVEAASDRSVGLLLIQPQAGARLLRMEGEARDVESLVRYIARLEEQPSLRDVHLTAHELRSEGGQRFVRFALSAAWVDS